MFLPTVEKSILKAVRCMYPQTVKSAAALAQVVNQQIMTLEAKAVPAELYVNCDYNSSTEGYGYDRFSNYQSAYNYAVNNNTKATIIVEKTNTLSSNTFDNNHKNYSRLAVVIKDGATMGDALSKWDMTYPVTVEPGGSLVMARPKSASVSNIHIKNTLTVGAEGSSDAEKKEGRSIRLDSDFRT